MTDEQKAAFVFAAAVRVSAQIESMKAENQHREMQGYSQAYGEEAFLEVFNREGITHNAILALFHD